MKKYLAIFIPSFVFFTLGFLFIQYLRLNNELIYIKHNFEQSVTSDTIIETYQLYDGVLDNMERLNNNEVLRFSKEIITEKLKYQKDILNDNSIKGTLKNWDSLFEKDKLQIPVTVVQSTNGAKINLGNLRKYIHSEQPQLNFNSSQLSANVGVLRLLNKDKAHIVLNYSKISENGKECSALLTSMTRNNIFSTQNNIRTDIGLTFSDGQTTWLPTASGFLGAFNETTNAIKNMCKNQDPLISIVIRRGNQLEDCNISQECPIPEASVIEASKTNTTHNLWKGFFKYLMSYLPDYPTE